MRLTGDGLARATGFAEVVVTTTEPARSDFQPTVEVARYFGRHTVTFPHLMLRVLVLLAVLVGFDVWTVGALGRSAYEGAYRLPRELPTTALPGYVHALDRHSESGAVRVVFLGASPTWGYRTKNAASTFPYAYAAAAKKAGLDVSAANLAANGQLVGDEYLLAKRVAADADILFVQLTYHMFDPRYEQGRLVRYPEMAQLPGVAVSKGEAELLSISPKAAYPVSSRIDGVLFDRWAAYRERSALAAMFFGGMPEDRLHQAWVKATTGKSPPREQIVGAEDFTSFDSLDPDQQMIAVARYAENASFTVSPKTPQMRVLRGLVEALHKRGTKVVFFMAPMNRDVIDYYALIDREQYLANSKRVRDVVRAGGFTYLDYNTAETPAFGPEYFADIDHTTDAGGRAVGRRLFEDTADYLRRVESGDAR